MKILFLTDNFWPEVNAPASRTLEHCRHWVRAGAEVTVITSAPNFPAGRVFDGYRNRLWQHEEVEGIRVVRVWTYMARNEGFFRRICDYLSFAATSFAAGLFEKADVIVATSPQFFTTWSGWALSVLKRRPWIFELRDIWPESLAAVGAMRSGRVLRLLERIELGLYARAAQVVAVSPAFVDNLVGRGVPRDKVSVVTNGVELGAFGPREADPALRRSLGLEGKFVLGYLGTHGMAHALDFVVEAAARGMPPQAHFLFIGDGAGKAAAVELAGRLGAGNTTFLPPVPRDRIADYLALCDVSLVPLRRSETFLSVIPSKMFEAAAMRLPILLGVDGQAREIVEGHDAGLFFEPEDAAAFRAAVHRLAADPALMARLRDGAARMAADYDRARLAATMLAKIEAVAGQASR